MFLMIAISAFFAAIAGYIVAEYIISTATRYVRARTRVSNLIARPRNNGMGVAVEYVGPRYTRHGRVID